MQFYIKKIFVTISRSKKQYILYHLDKFFYLRITCKKVLLFIKNLFADKCNLALTSLIQCIVNSVSIVTRKDFFKVSEMKVIHNVYKTIANVLK